MRLHPLTLLASVALVAITVVEAETVPTKRLLRTYKVSTDNEERTITTSGVETLANTLKSTTTVDDELKAWVTKGESADDAFKLLTLDKAADDLLSNPKLESWISHLKLFNEQNPSKQTTLIATLTAHYGDEGLAKIIEQGKRVEGTEAIANRIQAEQFQAWLTGEKSAGDVFKLLKLDKAEKGLLGNPVLESWISYMKLFNRQNPKKQTSLISTLAANYDDYKLATIFGLAERVESTALMAKRLEIELVNRWVETTARTPDDIFKLLKLDKANTDLFKMPEVNAWMKYKDAYNKKNPSAKVTFFSSLKETYNDEQLVGMLIAAKNVPSTKTIAKRVQSELTQRWLTNGKQPEDIFKLLKLNNAEEKDVLLQNPLFIAWVKYVDDFNLKHPKHEDLAISTMMESFSSVSLANMMLAASKSPNTESIAKRLDTELVEKWFQNGNTPGIVFTLLKLKQEEEKVLDSPLLATWLKFVDYFNKKNADAEISAISVLKTGLKDDVLANMLLVAHKNESTRKMALGLLEDLVAHWMTKARAPKKVAVWLRLDETPEKDVVDLFREYYKLYKQHFAK
ncbi:hypothetical protein PR003_g2815 [Phytophthora rubi]|uniref:RxLR effector PexRD54 WY domain-containing protein n=1 Tax=Phytophthora rubi TaxID=129364 RepID=A0A6A4FRQ4_9STRA|nr:hypothetical protein PR003_g2815 [Phytophthora rubi]